MKHLKFNNLGIKVKKALAFTLVEILLVVGIIATASTVALVTYQKYKIFNKINLVVNDLIASDTAIEQLIQSGYQHGPSPYGSVTQDLYNAKLLPRNFTLVNAYTAYSSYSDTYISFGGYNAVYNRIWLDISDIDTSVCRALVSRLYSNFHQIIPYSALGGISGGGYNTTPVQVKPSSDRLQQACDDYNDNGKISIQLVKKYGNGGDYILPYS